jgi:hypothetical protein
VCCYTSTGKPQSSVPVTNPVSKTFLFSDHNLSTKLLVRHGLWPRTTVTTIAYICTLSRALEFLSYPTEFRAGGTYTIPYSLADDSVCQYDLIVGTYFLGIGVSRRSSAATEPVETNKNGVKPAGERQEDERRTLESGFQPRYCRTGSVRASGNECSSISLVDVAMLRCLNPQTVMSTTRACVWRIAC